MKTVSTYCRIFLLLVAACVSAALSLTTTAEAELTPVELEVPDEAADRANWLGEEGGTVSTSDGRFSVEVPSGVLAEETYVQLTMPSGNSDGSSQEVVVELIPRSGQAIRSVQKPLSVTYTPAPILEAISEMPSGPDLTVGKYTDKTGSWEGIPKSYDETKGSLSFEITDLGRFVISEPVTTPTPEFVEIDAEQGGLFQPDDDSIRLEFPAGFTPSDVTIEYAEKVNLIPGGPDAVKQFELNAVDRVPRVL